MIRRVLLDVRSLVNTATRLVISDELTRKRAVVGYYRTLNAVRNLFRRDLVDSSESLMDWRSVLTARIQYPNEAYRGNAFYGIGTTLREFSGASYPLRGCIEHGVYFGDYVNSVETDNSGLPSIVTYGVVRRRHIEAESNVPVFEVGPYIAYAASAVPEGDLQDLHERLGNVLLVFPSHSIFNLESRFDSAALISEIWETANEIAADSILVCLYYQDLLNGRAEVYEDAGFTVVTAGHREDERFLGRLKAIIALSDFTMSNSVGTHVGYCAFLGKPHKILDQDIGHVALQGRQISGQDDPVAVSAALEKQEVAAVFSRFRAGLSDEQLEVCNRYWGFDKRRSAEDLRVFFETCDDVFSGGSPTAIGELRNMCDLSSTRDH